jgi:chromosome segregation ATPase
VAISDQIDTLQKRAADLKDSFEQTQHETSEQVKTRISQARADIAARQDAAKDQVEQAADRVEGHWQAMRADATAKMHAFQDRIDRKRDEHDAKLAAKDADAAAREAADALDYAGWAVDQAQLAVLYAVDARNRADTLAAAAPVES